MMIVLWWVAVFWCDFQWEKSNAIENDTTTILMKEVEQLEAIAASINVATTNEWAVKQSARRQPSLIVGVFYNWHLSERREAHTFLQMTSRDRFDSFLPTWLPCVWCQFNLVWETERERRSSVCAWCAAWYWSAYCCLFAGPALHYLLDWLRFETIHSLLTLSLFTIGTFITLTKN